MSGHRKKKGGKREGFFTQTEIISILHINLYTLYGAGKKTMFCDVKKFLDSDKIYDIIIMSRR
jgi:hypothetical protein